MSWRTYFANGVLPAEVVPIDDLREHVVDGKGVCWCGTFEDDGVIVHNSLDEREAFEEGKRKPS